MTLFMCFESRQRPEQEETRGMHTAGADCVPSRIRLGRNLTRGETPPGAEHSATRPQLRIERHGCPPPSRSQHSADTWKCFFGGLGPALLLHLLAVNVLRKSQSSLLCKTDEQSGRTGGTSSAQRLVPRAVLRRTAASRRGARFPSELPIFAYSQHEFRKFVPDP